MAATHALPRSPRPRNPLQGGSPASLNLQPLDSGHRISTSAPSPPPPHCGGRRGGKCSAGGRVGGAAWLGLGWRCLAPGAARTLARRGRPKLSGRRARLSPRAEPGPSLWANTGGVPQKAAGRPTAAAPRLKQLAHWPQGDGAKGPGTGLVEAQSGGAKATAAGPGSPARTGPPLVLGQLEVELTTLSWAKSCSWLCEGVCVCVRTRALGDSVCMCVVCVRTGSGECSPLATAASS